MSAIPPIEWEDGLTPERPKSALKVVASNTPEMLVPKGESAHALLERDIPEPVKLCDPWAVEGLNILASRPKLGKTTLVRQKMAAACTAGEFMDSRFISKIRCAFLSLEEGELLCRAKFKMAGFTDDALAGIQLFFDWPRGQSGIDLLDRYLAANQDVRYAAIDSLSKFRQVPDVRVPAFMADYEAMSALQTMTKKHPGVCIEVIHHTRKAKSEDPIDDISGTYGLTAAVDSFMVMRHHGDGALLYAGGRLWSRNESEYKLKKGEQRWEMLGANLGLTDEQEDTLSMIKDTPGGLGGQELSDKLGITRQSAWARLDALIEKGLAIKRYGRVIQKF